MERESISGTILIIDDTPANIGVLHDSLVELGHKVLVARNGAAGIETAKHAFPDLILLDVMMPEMDGFETCEQLKEDNDTAEIPVIFMTALSETEDKVRGFEVGAVDYITKPFQTEEVEARVASQLYARRLQEDLETENESRKLAEKRLQEANTQLEERVEERTEELRQALDELEGLKNRLADEVVQLTSEIKQEHNFEEIIGDSKELKAVLKKVELVGPTEASVLIQGESGTGKELIARAIHNASPLKDRPLIKVNCGAIATNLVESELFGHEKGAFTGAIKQRPGRFELADGGTLFLDEVGELEPEVQVKLLRVLQEGEFERLGGTETLHVEVRIIAATNRNLLDEVEKGNFREDLYYRLNVFPLQLPPLRERGGDIPLLAEFFLQKYAQKMGKSLSSIDESVKQRLEDYSWPGNIRELQNTIERSVILETGDALGSIDFIMGRSPKSAEPQGLDELEEYEKKIYLRALKEADWKIGGATGAAELLKRPVSTVRDRVKKLGLER